MRFAVLGAGNAGQTFAALLAFRGFDVKLWNRSSSTIEHISRNGGIQVQGLETGFAKVFVSADIQTVIHDADVIMVATPASAHQDIANYCAPYLHDEQTIVLNPGRTFGALEFLQTVREQGCTSEITIAEAQSLIYVCRALKPGLVKLTGIKKSLPVAAIPAFETSRVVRILKKIHKEFTPAKNILYTSMENMGAIFHPVPLIFNAARAEDPTVTYDHYLDGITPTVGCFLEQIDMERCNVAAALDVETTTAKDWLKKVYGSEGDTLCEIFQNTKNYKKIGAPSSLHHRYIFEDIPTGLVPIASIGQMLGVKTPSIGTFVHFVNQLLNVNFWAKGRTVGNLGIDDLTKKELQIYARSGEKPVLSSRSRFLPFWKRSRIDIPLSSTSKVEGPQRMGMI
ncbi:MAG: NAD/NADP octopine/nopaline dehydrogenase family protein [Candidatus Hodarchaeota archaeon]